jgi:hypothetical protein
MPSLRRRKPERERKPRVVDEQIIEGRVTQSSERALSVPKQAERPASEESRWGALPQLDQSDRASELNDRDRADRPPRPRKRRRRRPPPPRRGCMETCAMFAGLSMLAIALVIGCMFLAVTVQFLDFMRDPLDNFLEVFGFDQDAEPEVVESTTIILSIQQDLAFLETTRENILVSKDAIDRGAAPDAKITVNYIGRVTAGIDLNLITPEDVVQNPDGSLTITLPPAQITGCYLGKPEVVSRECTDIPLIQDCAKIVDGMVDNTYDRAILDLLEAADESDLLETAYLEAEDRVASLIDSLGYGVTVEFVRSAEEIPLDDTCIVEDD